ncbi:hypothetical protein E2562_039490 [Oryza meyeriana var. granulata]|uniref:Uncharacterized protein n=1 Tax=Oryza meyeriana var. granulata TaxID=110450 RepID=A0A6G1F291_9ORYZ|nr:hypothetical protein E2562_039490 [Oryza meyeriana var. granulata]
MWQSPRWVTTDDGGIPATHMGLRRVKQERMTGDMPRVMTSGTVFGGGSSTQRRPSGRCR